MSTDTSNGFRWYVLFVGEKVVDIDETGGGAGIKSDKDVCRWCTGVYLFHDVGSVGCVVVEDYGGVG